jgi:hypothetical protein
LGIKERTAHNGRIIKESSIVKKFLALAAVTICLITGLLTAKAQDKAAANGISGKWHFVLDTPGGDRDVDAQFTVDAEGKVAGTFGQTSAAGTYKDGQINLDFEMTAEETGETAHMKLIGKLDDAPSITGTWQFSSYDGTFKALRPKN